MEYFKSGHTNNPSVVCKHCYHLSYDLSYLREHVKKCHPDLFQANPGISNHILWKRTKKRCPINTSRGLCKTNKKILLNLAIIHAFLYIYSHFFFGLFITSTKYIKNTTSISPITTRAKKGKQSFSHNRPLPFLRWWAIEAVVSSSPSPWSFPSPKPCVCVLYYSFLFFLFFTFYNFIYVACCAVDTQNLTKHNPFDLYLALKKLSIQLANLQYVSLQLVVAESCFVVKTPMKGPLAISSRRVLQVGGSFLDLNWFFFLTKVDVVDLVFSIIVEK